MIQRVQSLYLLGALLASIALYYFPVLCFQSDATELTFYIGEVLDINKLVVLKTYPLIVVLVLVQLLLVFQIFNYRKRIRQIQTGNAVIILCGIFYLTIAAYLFNLINTMSDFKSLSVSIGLFIPLIVIAFVFMANKHIKKDEDLVRSVDRIR